MESRCRGGRVGSCPLHRADDRQGHCAGELWRFSCDGARLQAVHGCLCWLRAAGCSAPGRVLPQPRRCCARLSTHGQPHQSDYPARTPAPPAGAGRHRQPQRSVAARGGLPLVVALPAAGWVQAAGCFGTWRTSWQAPACCLAGPAAPRLCCWLAARLHNCPPYLSGRDAHAFATRLLHDRPKVLRLCAPLQPPAGGRSVGAAAGPTSCHCNMSHVRADF